MVAHIDPIHLPRQINWFRYSLSFSVKFTTNIVFLDMILCHIDLLR